MIKNETGTIAGTKKHKGNPAGTFLSKGIVSLRRSGRRALHVKSMRSLSGDIGNLIFLILFSAIMLVPMLYVVNNAFKPMDELFLYPPRFFVHNPTFDNFYDLSVILSNSWIPFERYLFNTVSITAVGTGLHVILSSMAAYALEKHRFNGKDWLFSLIVVTLLFNTTVTSIPNFLILSRLGLVDTVWALIFPAIGSPMGLFLMKQFMSGLHDSMLEAARIDGAGEMRIFFRIVMPNVKPAWMTLIIFSTQSLWNTTGGVLIRTEKLKPLAYTLTQISAGGITRAGAAAAVSVVLMAVPVTIFIFAQSQVLDTMAASGIKE